MKSKTVMVIDCLCNQDVISKLTQMIYSLENNNYTSLSIVKYIADIAKDERISFSVKNWVKGPIDKFERPVEDGNAKTVVLKPIENNFLRTEMLVNSINKRNLHYHFRFQFNDFEDINYQVYNLRFFILMLQYFKSKRLAQKRISAFLIPRTGKVFPFEDSDKETDFELYNVASEYLRLISKTFTGTIYGVVDIKGVTVKALDFKKTNCNGSLFPVIFLNKTEKPNAEINYNIKTRENKAFLEKNYNYIDNYSLLFNEEISKNNILKAFKSRNAIPFNFANHENAFIGLADNLVHSSVLRLKNKINGKNSEELKRKIAEQSNGLSRFAFALFSYLYYPDESNDSDNKLIRWIGLSSEISSAILQLVQNSLQHSEKNQCIISLYLKKTGDLVIQVSDINEKDTLIENFIKNIKNELSISKNRVDLSGYNALINKEAKIKLGDFFCNFTESNIKKEWFEFRRSDSSAHVGFAILAQLMKKCKAKVEIISSKNFFVQEDGIYIYDYLTENLVSENDERGVIPGTQIQITIPKSTLPLSSAYETEIQQRNLSQLRSHNLINENYSSYAAYLNYDSECISEDLIDGIGFIEKSNFISYEEKIKRQLEYRDNWDRFFSDLLDERTLYYADLSNIRISFDTAEIAVKGLVSYLSEYCAIENKFIAFMNSPVNLLKAVKTVLSVLPLKNFPPNIQICFMGEKTDNGSVSQFILSGRLISEVVNNSYMLSLERGNISFDLEDCILSNNMAKQFSEFLSDINRNGIYIDNIMPFELLLKEKGEKLNIFFSEIKKLANKPIDVFSGIKGYKFEKTHIMLGNKIHIQSFYELSFLFYRTMMANSVAFYILRDLILNNIINPQSDNVMFYGYASYSQAIVVSLAEMLEAYLQEREFPSERRAFYATYQYNLQSEMMPEDIKIYVNEDSFREQNNLKIVQIVPISSTVTTFKKIKQKFKNEFTSVDFEFVKNYTVFLVREGEEERRIHLEKNYWNDIKHNVVTTNDGLKVDYIMSSSATWYEPQFCELCFPEKSYNEVPIIHTDHTSTVPTQQIGNRYKVNNLKQSSLSKADNNYNIRMLNGCVFVGHIERGKNHFSYYIDTQKYFSKVRNNVKEWLIRLSPSEIKDDKLLNAPNLNIIFSPEHNTNVGFSQYVNAFYFGGLAEVISVRVEKEFRTNFVCEHDSLRKTITKLFDDYEKSGYDASLNHKPLKFYFVDDNIITGDAFKKATDLLHSLIPMHYRSLYGNNVFEKCFVLIDRLSNATKWNYVKEPNKNFLSFCHFDISNMRNKGDSCVGCKSHEETTLLFKRSATNSFSEFWNKKLNSTEIRNFGKAMNSDDNEIIKGDSAYKKLVLSHILHNLIYYFGCSISYNYYDFILCFIECVISGDFSALNSSLDCELEIDLFKNVFFSEGIDEKKRYEIIVLIIQILSQPFFSFDFELKTDIMRFLILFSETFFGEFSDKEKRKKEIEGNAESPYWKANNRFERTYSVAVKMKGGCEVYKSNSLYFYRDMILRPLIELNSNYLIRVNTIDKIYKLMKSNHNQNNTASCADFWQEYASGIHKLIDCGEDDSKYIRLEKLLNYGYGDNQHLFPLYETITKNDKRDFELLRCFNKFCHELFLQNSGIIYNAMESKKGKEGSSLLRDFFKEDSLIKPKLSNTATEEEKAYYLFFKDIENKGNDDYSLNKKYNSLFEKMQNMISSRYDIDEKDVSFALLTCSQLEEQQIDMINMDFITIYTKGQSNNSSEKYEIKRRIIDACNKNQKLDLLNDGYYVNKILSTEDNNAGAYCIMRFGGTESADTIAYNLVDVFIYVEIKNRNDKKDNLCTQKQCWQIMRSILSCRHSIIKMLASDFNSDAISNYAHSAGTGAILEHEKAASHSPVESDIEMLEVISAQKDDITKTYPGITQNNGNEFADVFKWLLLRGYVNSQIAKLFNRVVSQLGKDANSIQDFHIDSRQLFVGNAEICKDTRNEPFKVLSNVVKCDARFEMLKKVIIFEIDSEIGSRKIIHGTNGVMYNLEIIKCIFLRICFDALKYKSSDGAQFLTRINKFMNTMSRIQSRNSNSDSSQNRIDDYYYKNLINRACTIQIYAENSDNNKYDWLVIKNNVNINISGIYGKNYSKKIRKIRQKLQDPLDYADGHLSLLTIKNYIELLPGVEFDKLYNYMFNYQWDENKESMYFITKLPILAKEDNNE